MTDPTRRGIGGDYKFSIEVPVADVDRALQLVSLAEHRRVAATGTLEVGQVVLGSTGTLTVKTQTLTDDLLFSLGATEVGRFSSAGLTLPGASNIIFGNAANHSITTTQSVSTVGRALTISAGSSPATATAASQTGGAVQIVSGAGATAVDLTFSGGSGGDFTVTTGAGGQGAGNQSGQQGGNILLTGGLGGNAGATGFGGGSGGAFQFTAGNGGTAGTTTGPGGAGGGITITTGNGGNASTGSQSGGTSGSLILTTGLGGAASAAAAAGTTSSITLSPGNSQPALGTRQAGSAGGVIVSPGAGGAGGTSTGGSSAGQFLTLGSAGGIAGTVSGSAGSGSSFSWSGGAGGAANTGTGAAGAGGAWTSTAGAGGAATTTGAAGIGGSFTLTAGVGGSSAASVNAAGVGGSLTFAGGAGGSNGGAGGNNGGGVTLRGGAATGAGVSGVVTIGATNTSAVNIGAASITTTISGTARVSAGGRPDLLFVDAGTARVGINRAAGTHGATLDVDNLAVSEDIFYARQNGTARVLIGSSGHTQIQPGSSAGATALTLSSASSSTGRLLDMDVRSTSTTGLRQFLGGSGNPTKGIEIDWATNYVGTNAADFAMLELDSPVITKSSGVSPSTYHGVLLDASLGGLTHTSTNTLTWYGNRVVMPSVTKAAVGGTLNARGVEVNIGTFGGDYGVATGLRITASGTGARTQVGLAGIDITNVTPGTGGSAAVGIQVGTGWDSGVLSYSPVLVASDRSSNGVTSLGLVPLGLTAQPASTEISDFALSSGTIQFNTGALALQRSSRLESQTYSFVGASTIANAVGLEVSPPKAGTNATISAASGIRVPTTNVNPGGTLVTTAYGILVAPPTGATQNYAGRLTGPVFIGSSTSADTAEGKFAALYATGTTLTGQTAGTPVFDVILGPTIPTTSIQYNSGSIGLQATTLVGNRTYSFTAASTISEASTLYVAGAPIAGTNATIVENRALWVQAGTTHLGGGVEEPKRALYSFEFIDDMVRTSGQPISSDSRWAAVSTGAVAGQTSAPIPGLTNNSFGISSMNTGVAATSGIQYVFGTTDLVRPNFGKLVCGARIQFSTLSTALQEYVFRFGFSNTTGQTAGTDYAMFEYNRAALGTNVWFTVTGNDGVNTSSQESAVAVNTWYDLRIEWDRTASSVEYYIDDVLVQTQTGAPVPTNADLFGIQLQIFKLVGTTARTAFVDFVYGHCYFNTER
jgi:hypothetical protein